VDFGIHIGTRGCLTNRENMMRVARGAEENGYAIVGIPDHLVMPAEPEGTYPYTATGLHPAAQSGECFDLLATLAFLAGCTEKIRLLTSVVVTPHRPPILTAKLFQTVDVLSGGRLIAGAGAGWMKAEFDALRTEPFEERGAVTDEYIEAWKILWTQARPSMQGKYVQFDNIMFEPKPVQKPHPPVWFGGSAPAAMRRAVRHGHGFMGAGSQTTAQFAEQVTVVRQELSAQGRAPDSFPIGKRVYIHVDDDAARARQQLEDALTRHYGRGGWSEHMVTGPPEACIAGVRAVTDAGAELILFNSLVDDAQQLERLAAEVIPALT
jgi:probable F420-dependent oxidoreductase